jgi:hypothetical protein
MTFLDSRPPKAPPTGDGPDQDLVRITSGRDPGSFSASLNTIDRKIQHRQNTDKKI